MADPRINTAEMIEHGICRAIRRILGLRVTEVNLAHRLVEDLQCESIDLIEIPMAIEDRFGIEISDDEAAACKTVADYSVLTRAKLAMLHPQAPTAQRSANTQCEPPVCCAGDSATGHCCGMSDR